MNRAASIPVRAAILCLLAGAVSGCALGLAPIASAANFGYSAWSGSRLRFVEDASFENVTMAAERALVGLDLRVELTSEIRKNDNVRVRVYQIRSDRGDLAILKLVRLSPTMTDLTLDMGILGNRPAGELMADHIRWYTDGDTIRTARRAAMESHGAPWRGAGAPQADESGTGEGGDPGPDFGKGLL